MKKVSFAKITTLSEKFLLLGMLGNSCLKDLEILTHQLHEEMKSLNNLSSSGNKEYNFKFENSTTLEAFGGFSFIFNNEDTNQFAGYETEVPLFSLII